MVTRRDFIKKSGLAIAAAAMSGSPLKAMMGNNGQGSGASAAADGYVCQRPKPEERHFTSKAVEEVIAGTKKKLKDPKLAWMFENCFPNTLDTTVNFKMIDGKPDTFVITGDIDAMWLRDSGAQVWPYVALCKKDEQLRLLIAGVINRQTKLIQIDRYANGFTHGAESSEWATDLTEMKPYVHERKWEIDSLCYPIRLAYQYWKVTGDTSVFDQEWKKSMALVLQTFKEQQRKDGHGPYKFQRVPAAGLYFTIRTGLIQFRLFGESIRVVKEKPKEKGSISSFGALMVSTASRVGTGNIVGVSTAICLGGFGAVFWMWVVALVGGASAFIESALAQVYKKRDADGSSYGGPSYYMEQALHQRWLGVVFAVVLILTYVVGFNMLAAYNLQDAFGGFSFYVNGPHAVYHRRDPCGAVRPVRARRRQAPDRCHGRARAGHGSAVYRDVARRRVHEHQDLPERHRQHLPRSCNTLSHLQRGLSRSDGVRVRMYRTAVREIP